MDVVVTVPEGRRIKSHVHLGVRKSQGFCRARENPRHSTDREEVPRASYREEKPKPMRLRRFRLKVATIKLPVRKCQNCRSWNELDAFA